ncbi:MAG: hypothetical protein ABIH49_00105 [archaeon]
MERGEGIFCFLKERRGQIWIETVIYTLIALTLIGAVLAFITPRIGEIQDKAIVEQSIGLMENLNNVILSVVQGGAGNKRIIDLSLKKGTLNIDSVSDEIVFEMESEYEYSQIGEVVEIGSLTAKTEESGSLNKITLISNQNKYDLTYNGDDTEKEISKSTTPYKLSIENKGESGGKIVVDINLV